MKNNRSTIKLLFIFLFSVLFTAAVAAQEKESKSCGNSCCDGNTKIMHQRKMNDSTMDHSNMDHSMMNHQNMDENADPTAVNSNGSAVIAVDADLQAWNAVCPVRGEDIDPEGTKVQYNGKVYAFCCSGCISKFKKDPEKYSKNLSDDGKLFVGTP